MTRCDCIRVRKLHIYPDTKTRNFTFPDWAIYLLSLHTVILCVPLPLQIGKFWSCEKLTQILFCILPLIANCSMFSFYIFFKFQCPRRVESTKFEQCFELMGRIMSATLLLLAEVYITGR